jgi:hypothetical protein
MYILYHSLKVQISTHTHTHTHTHTRKPLGKKLMLQSFLFFGGTGFELSISHLLGQACYHLNFFANLDAAVLRQNFFLWEILVFS